MADIAETGNGTFAYARRGELVDWALSSDPGTQREHNEDFAGAFVPPGLESTWERGPLFIVADGMGGHAAGEVASKVAVERVLNSWVSRPPSAPSQMLRTAVRDANIAVLDTAITGNLQGMGTTIVAAALAGHEAIIAHVGDSRAYLVHGDECTQITADHSRVAEMVRMRMITPEQAAVHPSRSMLTRNLGGEMTVQVDLDTVTLAEQDALVLCTDGLWDLVSRPELAEHIGLLREGKATAANEVCALLVDLALKRGATDNVTCLVARVMTDRPIPGAGAKRSLFRRGRS